MTTIRNIEDEYEMYRRDAICKPELMKSYNRWLIEQLIASRDSRTLSAVPSELLKKIEELSKIVPMPPKAITYENGVEIVNFVQDIIMPEYYNWVKRGIAG